LVNGSSGPLTQDTAVAEKWGTEDKVFISPHPTRVASKKELSSL